MNTPSLLSMRRLDRLVIQVLRMIGLRKKEPAFRHQAQVLDYKRGQQYIQSGRTQAIGQQGDRYREYQDQEYPFYGAHEAQACTMEKFTRIKGSTHEALRLLLDLRVAYANGRLQG